MVCWIYFSLFLEIDSDDILWGIVTNSRELSGHSLMSIWFIYLSYLRCDIQFKIKISNTMWYWYNRYKLNWRNSNFIIEYHPYSMWIYSLIYFNTSTTSSEPNFEFAHTEEHRHSNTRKPELTRSYNTSRASTICPINRQRAPARVCAVYTVTTCVCMHFLSSLFSRGVSNRNAVG